MINQEEKRDLVLNLIILTMINQEEKRDLVLNLIILTMTNQEEKRDLVLNLIVLKMKIEKNLNIHLNLKSKNTVERGKIQLFKILFGAARQTRTVTGIPHLALNQACLPIPT